jgi:hypothetical protein
MKDAIEAMDNYKRFDYQPRSGTACESLDPSCAWKTSIVTNTARKF